MFKFYQNSINFVQTSQNQDSIEKIIYFMDQTNLMINLRLGMNTILVTLSFLCSFSIIICLRKFVFFQNILISIGLILKRLVFILSLFVISIINFGFSYHFYIGQKFQVFNSKSNFVFLMQNLIRVENLEEMTGNFDDYVILLLFVPYIIIFKMSFIPMILGIIYLNVEKFCRSNTSFFHLLKDIAIASLQKLTQKMSQKDQSKYSEFRYSFKKKIFFDLVQSTFGIVKIRNTPKETWGNLLIRNIVILNNELDQIKGKYDSAVEVLLY